MADKKAPGKRLPRAFDDEMIQRWNKKTRRYYSHGTKNDDEMIHLRTFCSSRHLFGESLCHFQGFVVEHMLSTDREFKLQAANCPWPKSLWRPRRSHAIFRLVGKDKLHYSKSKRPLPPPLSSCSCSSPSTALWKQQQWNRVRTKFLAIPMCLLWCLGHLSIFFKKKQNNITQTLWKFAPLALSPLAPLALLPPLLLPAFYGPQDHKAGGSNDSMWKLSMLSCSASTCSAISSTSTASCSTRGTLVISFGSILLNWTQECASSSFTYFSLTYIHCHHAETNMFAHYIAGTIFCGKCLLASLGITCLHNILP